MYTGKKVTRVDAYDKVLGRTKYADDLCDKSAYIIQILHASIAHGKVRSILFYLMVTVLFDYLNIF